MIERKCAVSGFVPSYDCGVIPGLAAAAAAAAKSAPAIGFIFCSHGVEQLAIAVFVPEAEKGT